VRIALCRLSALPAICGLLCLFATPLFAQTASQITPPSFRPNLERQGGFALPGTPGLATPPG
jgi:hypothetical protein